MLLERIARPVFLTACGCNLAFAIIGAFAIEGQYIVGNPLATLGGGVSFAVAAVSGLIILRDYDGMHRAWIKAALVFLILGPLAYWGLQWPAAVDTVCIDCQVSAAVQARAIGDVMQSQMAMIAVALAALFCAARAMIMVLEELAV